MATSLAFWDYDALDPIRLQVQLRHIEPDVLREYLANQTEDMRRSAETGDKVFLVIEARAGMLPPPEVRKMQARWLSEHQSTMSQSVLGIAFVVDNPMVRGALTAIFWVSSPPIPYRVFPTLEKAMAHAVDSCDAAGLSIPDAARNNPTSQIERELDRYLSRSSSRRIERPIRVNGSSRRAQRTS